MEVEKLTTHDTEPRLQLKQKNQSPQIHNRLVGSVSSLVCCCGFLFFQIFAITLSCFYNMTLALDSKFQVVGVFLGVWVFCLCVCFCLFGGCF